MKKNQLNVHFTFHYVDNDGPYTNWQFDTRPNLRFFLTLGEKN